MDKGLMDVINERYEKRVRLRTEDKITPESEKKESIQRYELIHKLITIVSDKGMSAYGASAILGEAASEIEAAAMSQKL